MVKSLRSCVGACLLALCACAGSDAAPGGVRFQAAARDCQNGEVGCLAADTSRFEIDGMTVIHARVPGNPIFSANLLFSAGPRLHDARKAFAEKVVLQTIDWWGSGAFRDWSAELGDVRAVAWAEQQYDYAEIGIEGALDFWQRDCQLLSAAFTRPPIDGIDDSYLHTLIAPDLLDLATRSDDPANGASTAAWSLVTDTHPDQMARAQKDELEKLTPSDLRDAADALRDPRRITVIVIADLTHSQVEQLVHEHFGFAIAAAGRASSAASNDVPPLRVGGTRTQILDYPDSPLWHIRGYFPAPSSTDREAFAASQLSAAVLDARLFDELRVADALAYTVGFEVFNQKANAGTLWLSTDRPAEAMQAVRETIESLLRDGVSEDELQAARASYLSALERNSDNSYARMQTLGTWQLVAGDWAAIEAHLSAIAEVSTDNVRDSLAAALPGMRYAAAGPGGELDERQLLADPADAESTAPCAIACPCGQDGPSC